MHIENDTLSRLILFYIDVICDIIYIWPYDRILAVLGQPRYGEDECYNVERVRISCCTCCTRRVYVVINRQDDLGIQLRRIGKANKTPY